jgi:ribose transport system ATP-binding protein
MAELALRGIRKAFGATIALDGVDLALRSGEVHALVGENGAGKSTLMKVLAGATAQDAGTMSLDGQPYEPSSPHDALARGVAMIYQELSLLPNLSVAENIGIGHEPVRGPGLLDRGRLRQRAREALALVGLENQLDVDARTGRLPLSIQQLIEVARATARGARVLVFDEPTSSLSRGEAERLFALIERLRAQGLAIAYISHFMEELKIVAQRYTVLRDGRSVGDGLIADTSEEQLVALMVGNRDRDSDRERELERNPDRERDRSPPLLSVSGRGETLELRPGEIVGLAGLAGSGRTELLRAIFGLDPAPDLVVSLKGDTRPGNVARRWSQGAGCVSEDRKTEGLALGLSIAENTVLSRFLPPGPRAVAARRWISELSIKSRGPEQLVGQLSGGNQQKVALARLLHHQCELFLLDEPTRGIDVGAKADLYALIRRQAAEGRAVLVTSSDLLELLRLCDRIGVMARGRLRALRPASDWTEHRLLEEAIA